VTGEGGTLSQLQRIQFTIKTVSKEVEISMFSAAQAGDVFACESMVYGQ
jgi:hypothetical protein